MKLNLPKMSKKGQLQGVMALILIVIGIIGIGIPITQQVIDDGNLSGLTSTVVSFVPVFLGLAVLVAAASFTSFSR